MPERLYDRLFLFLRCFRRPAVLTFRQIIVLPFDDPTLPFGLRNIQVCHMETILFLHPRLDLLICSPLLKPGHFHVFKRELNSDFIARYISLGKLDNRLNMARGNVIAVTYHMPVLPIRLWEHIVVLPVLPMPHRNISRFCLFARCFSGTYPLVLGTCPFAGTYQNHIQQGADTSVSALCLCFV